MKFYFLVLVLLLLVKKLESHILRAMNPPDLIDVLDELRLSLAKLSDRLNKSGVERTTGLKRAMGDDCAFYQKSKDLFLRKDYDQVMELFLKVLDQYRIVEGRNFGSPRSAGITDIPPGVF